MKRLFLVVTLLIALVGSTFAQTNLYNKIRENAFDSAVTAVEAGKNRKSAYEEYLEEQTESSDIDYDEACNILANCVITVPQEKNVYIKAYCYPIKDYVWYTLFMGDDGNLWINISYDDNDNVGELFFASKFRDFEYIKAIDDTTGTSTAAIKMQTTNDYIIFIQDKYDLYSFSISW